MLLFHHLQGQQCLIFLTIPHWCISLSDSILLPPSSTLRALMITLDYLDNTGYSSYFKVS